MLPPCGNITNLLTNNLNRPIYKALWVLIFFFFFLIEFGFYSCMVSVSLQSSTECLSLLWENINYMLLLSGSLLVSVSMVTLLLGRHCCRCCAIVLAGGAKNHRAVNQRLFGWKVPVGVQIIHFLTFSFCYLVVESNHVHSLNYLCI